MIKKLISIACLVLAVSACGCQVQTSSNSVVEFEAAAIQTNEGGKTINASVLSDKNSPAVIAYYFHRTMRCPTCLAIETNAARVIENSFPQQIADGRLTWISYNLDEPGGKELEKEFSLSVSTLVLSKMTNGNHAEHKKLEKVWDFIGDPVKFDSYVKNEVKQFLNE